MEGTQGWREGRERGKRDTGRQAGRKDGRETGRGENGLVQRGKSHILESEILVGV